MGWSWSGATKGGISGASTGAAINPVYGTPIGAAVGFLSGGFFGDDKGAKTNSGTNAFGARNDALTKVPTGTPEMEALHKANLAKAMGMGEEGGGYQQAQDYYNRLLGPNYQQGLEEFSEPYIRQFNEQIIPRVGERYAGMNALSSSGFQQALGGASEDLQSQLAQMFSQYRAQAAQAQTGQYNQLTQTGLNYNPFAYVQEEGTKGGLGSFFEGLTKDPKQMEGIFKGIMSLFKTKNPADLSSEALNKFAPNYGVV